MDAKRLKADMQLAQMQFDSDGSDLNKSRLDAAKEAYANSIASPVKKQDKVQKPVAKQEKVQKPETNQEEDQDSDTKQEEDQDSETKKK